VSIKSYVAPASFGASALALAFVICVPNFGSRPERVEVAELEEIRGLSRWRTIYSMSTCSEYNSSIANDPNQPKIPGQPSGPIVPVDSCTSTTTSNCLECAGNATQFTGAQNPNGSDPNGKTDAVTMPCGDLYFGRCMSNGVGGFTCNNSGSPSAHCADATEYHNQPIPILQSPTGQ